ncbi:MAG: cupin domain-containing protein [Chitinispirillaceae bacterium]
MRHLRIRPEGEFRVVAGTERSQAAVMVLEPGETTGSVDNMHLHCDQWLYVLSGNGKAVVEELEITLEPGVLLLIERGEVHEIFAGGKRLETLNFYAPPEYPVD